MSLLREIQESLMQEDTDIGPILLKFRFLASRLGSDKLEEWVHYEMEGYPKDVTLPDYRKMAVSYKGTFFGSFGSGVRDAPIPPVAITEYAGEGFLTFPMRQSAVAVGHLLRENTSDSGTMSFDVSDLIFRLQGKVYSGMACNSVTGFVSMAEVAALLFSVQNRVLELTTKLEKSVPAAATIVIDQKSVKLPEEDTRSVTHVTNQVIYSNHTAISSSGTATQFALNIDKGDTDAFIKALTEGGIPKSDAQELAKIVSKENPKSKEEPLGERIKSWLAKNGEKVGMSVVTKLLNEAVMRYFGLKDS